MNKDTYKVKSWEELVDVFESIDTSCETLLLVGFVCSLVDDDDDDGDETNRQLSPKILIFRKIRLR